MGKRIVVTKDADEMFRRVVFEKFGKKTAIRDNEELVEFIINNIEAVTPMYGIITVYELPESTTSWVIVNGEKDGVHTETLLYVVDGIIHFADDELIVKTYEDESWDFEKD